MTTSHIMTVTKVGLATATATVMAAGLLGAPAFAATGETGESATAAATQSFGCRKISGSPKGAPNADIAVRYCWKGKRVTWTAYFYPRGTRIALEATGVYGGVVHTKKSRPRVSYDTARGSFRKARHVWFKACKVRGSTVFYACTVLR
ncbi:hypothetical protein ACTWPT_29880 [Nonomuraea sp. 3N208]|uniref:hypothetical protein n=1 Tax=Nonomuraea sp. 3N208 TaxID=3457421 RepID=UPI003FD42C6C